MEQRPAELSYDAYVRAVTIRSVPVSLDDLTKARAGGAARRARLGPRHVSRLLGPYVGEKSWEQARAVLPLALYLAVFQLVILRQGLADPWLILAGMVAVIAGLMLFMEGLRVGLMPFGETIGRDLPHRLSLPKVLAVAGLLGVGVTFAEPAIGALRAAGGLVKAQEAPILFALLEPYSDLLVLAVGLGVGLAAILGMLRILHGWSLKPFIFASLAVCLGLSSVCLFDENLAPVLGLAWDCGAVTTGPVTVPLVLALGIGVAATSDGSSSSLSGFGVVTLASLFPIAAVLILALGVAVLGPEPAALMGMAAAMGDAPWYGQTPFAEVLAAVRAIVPLVIFLWLVARYLAKATIEDSGLVLFGLALAVVGMAVFGIGLSYGLSNLGAQTGGAVPAAFAAIPKIPGSPLYDGSLGAVLVLVFALALGVGATVAEPALNALGTTVETLTNGVLRRGTLIMAVSAGVGVGITLGVAKLMFGLELFWLLLGGYALAAIMTAFAREEFVNVAWDSAGVTTGPVTVPLVLAMGLGLGEAAGLTSGFGILAMASVCPIISVLAVGLYADRRAPATTETASAGAAA